MLDKKILIVDDDFHIRQLVERAFTREGMQVYQASNGLEGLRQFYRQRPDLVILDIMMPEADGWETCRQIRQLSDVPILMLTALDQDEDIIRGLDYGADDFLSKPFSTNVLLARARAVLRRAALSPEEEKPLAYDDNHLTIDLEAHRVLVRRKPIKLTRTEYRLLTYLLQHAGRVRTSQQILENVWGWEYQDSIDYVHVYISHLRRKIEEDPKNPKYLLTEHRVGYRFEKQIPN